MYNQVHLALALPIYFTRINLNLNAMNKLLNYSAIKHYKLPSRKNVFKYADTIIAVIFLVMLIKQLFS